MNSSSYSSFKLKTMTMGTVKMLYLPEKKDSIEGLNTKIKRVDKLALRKLKLSNNMNNHILVQSPTARQNNVKSKLLLQLSSSFVMNIYNIIFILLFQIGVVLLFDIVSKMNSIRIY
jgi:hypothetical protein